MILYASSKHQGRNSRSKTNNDCGLFLMTRLDAWIISVLIKGPLNTQHHIVFKLHTYICMKVECTRSDQKFTVIFKFRKLRMFDFRIFCSVMLVHMAVTCSFLANVSHFGLSVCFWQRTRSVVFICALRCFTIRKNW